MSQHIAKITDGRGKGEKIFCFSSRTNRNLFSHITNYLTRLSCTWCYIRFISILFREPASHVNVAGIVSGVGGGQKRGLYACICLRACSLQSHFREISTFLGFRLIGLKRSHQFRVELHKISTQYQSCMTGTGPVEASTTERHIERDTCCTKSIMMLERCWMLNHFVNSPALSHFISQRLREWRGQVISNYNGVKELSASFRGGS